MPALTCCCPPLCGGVGYTNCWPNCACCCCCCCCCCGKSNRCCWCCAATDAPLMAAKCVGLVGSCAVERAGGGACCCCGLDVLTGDGPTTDPEGPAAADDEDICC